MKRARVLAVLIVFASSIGGCASEPVSFTPIDAKQVLSYGVMGLGFLLAAMAFLLLVHQKLSSADSKSKERALYGFMLFSIALVGFGLASQWLRSKAPSTLPGPCYAAQGWPRGEWYLWGRFDNHRPTKGNTDDMTRIPQIFPQAIFDSDHSFRSETEENAEKPNKNAMDRTYVAVALNGGQVKRNAVVVFQGNDNTKPVNYEMTESLRVSDDGCMLTGRWQDNRGNFGDEHYLYRSDRYYVPVKTDDGQ
jgi:hypothetical protein